MRAFPRVVRMEGHTFLPLRDAAVVVDGGYNKGSFSAQVLEKYNARVIAFEPDAEVRASSQDTRVELRSTAIGDGTPAVLSRRPGADASLVFSGDSRTVVPTVRLEALIEEFECIDLLKLDIEGTENDALASVSLELLKRVGQLAVEFHDFIDPSLTPGVEAAKLRLRRAGFREIRFSRNNTDVLFVNAARIHISEIARFWLLFRYRYVRGAHRLIRRKLAR